jgi:hypothetical protein
VNRQPNPRTSNKLALLKDDRTGNRHRRHRSCRSPRVPDSPGRDCEAASTLVGVEPLYWRPLPSDVPMTSPRRLGSTSETQVSAAFG